MADMQTWKGELLCISQNQMWGNDWGSKNEGEIKSDPENEGLPLDTTEKRQGFPMAK